MRAVFLDRDGVINKYPGDLEYVKTWEEFQFLPDAKRALKKLYDAGFLLYVISNQAGVSKGVYPQEALDRITQSFLDDLLRNGVTFSGVYYCTHRQEDNCACRKPKSGLVLKAIKESNDGGIEIDRLHSYFIGDTIRDIETGRSAGLKTILVFSGKEKRENKHAWHTLPDFTAQDLSQAAEIILEQEKILNS